MESDRVKARALTLFDAVGIARLDEADTDTDAERLRAWLARGFHADMAWMDNPKRFDPTQVLPGARSVISVALNYYTPHAHSDDPSCGKISRYGWGRDYHRLLQGRLKQLARWLEAEGARTRYYADTGPVQDKVWAQRAGLGWIAKNSTLITRDRGSWVFLGSVFTTQALAPDAPHTEHCGTCTRCLDACPTDAIAEPFVVDANRCIAYHTIENRAEELPEAIAANLNGWVAGCDICQDVCPWNQRFARPTACDDFAPYPDNRAPRLTDLATLDEAEWDRRFRASALRRIKPAMWRRNARANLKFAPNSPPT